MLQVLKVQYGNDDIVQQGVELLVASLSKIYDTLQAAYKGLVLYEATNIMYFEKYNYITCKENW